MNIEKTINNIGKAEVPPFLFTRIQAKIEAEQAVVGKVRLASLGVALAGCLLVVSLIGAFKSSQTPTGASIENVFQLSVSNQLYGE